MEDYDKDFQGKAKDLVRRLISQNKVVTNRHMKRFSVSRASKLDYLEEILNEDLIALKSAEEMIAETKEKIKKNQDMKEEMKNDIGLAREYLKGSVRRCIENKLDPEKKCKKCKKCEEVGGCIENKLEPEKKWKEPYICGECGDCFNCVVRVRDCDECNNNYYTSDDTSDDSGTEYNTDDYDSDEYPDYVHIDNYEDDDYDPNPHFEKIQKRLRKEMFKHKHLSLFRKERIEYSNRYEELESEQDAYESLCGDINDLYSSREKKLNNLDWAIKNHDRIEKEMHKKKYPDQ